MTGISKVLCNPPQRTSPSISRVRLPALAKAKLSAQMLLQVHDELLFEVPDKEIDKAKEVARQVMESAATLSVPLVVETGVGANWAAAH